MSKSKGWKAIRQTKGPVELKLLVQWLNRIDKKNLLILDGLKDVESKFTSEICYTQFVLHYIHNWLKYNFSSL